MWFFDKLPEIKGFVYFLYQYVLSVCHCAWHIVNSQDILNDCLLLSSQLWSLKNILIYPFWKNMTIFVLGQSLFSFFPCGFPKTTEVHSLNSKVLKHFRYEMYLGQWSWILLKSIGILQWFWLSVPSLSFFFFSIWERECVLSVWLVRGFWLVCF